MDYTGERFVPWEPNVQANYEHYHRYRIALNFARSKDVLDMASGEGYGSALLASIANSVTGVDIDDETVTHASNKYIQDNLKFIKGAIQDIPLQDQVFDLITCFEAIEHVSEQEKVLDEAFRLLTDNGLFLISTPNKLVFTDETGQNWPWHVKEFYYAEFQDLLKNKFHDVIFLGQKLLTGSTIWPLDVPQFDQKIVDHVFVQFLDKELNFVDFTQQKPMFFLAIASKRDLTDLRESIRGNNLIDVSLNLLKEKNDWIDKLKNDVMTLDQMVRAKENETSSLHLSLERSYKSVQSKEAEISDLKNQILSLHNFIQKKEEDIRISASFINDLHKSRIWKVLLIIRSIIDQLAPAGSFRRRLFALPLSIYRRVRKGTAQTMSSPPTEKNSPDTEIVDFPSEPPSQPINQIAVCTIASKNYLSQVRIFAKSIKRTNPSVTIYVLLADRVENKFDPAEEPYHLITIDELKNIPNPSHLFFKYSPIELNTAIKPYFLEHLLKNLQFDKVCYFDPDIYVFSELDGLWALLDLNAMVVTPHITEPYNDNHNPSELEINLAGVFNLGFLALSNTPATLSFLSWWKERLYEFCYLKPNEGMHVDQNWVNFAPVMYDSVFILRDPAYNIAYWNLHERGARLRFSGENLYIDNRPAIFFHFSGFDPKNIQSISRHQNRFTLNDFPNIKPLYEYYRSLLKSAGYDEISKWNYAFSKFDNGVRIPEIARSIYGRLDKKQLGNFRNPFNTTSQSSFINWINHPADRFGHPSVIPSITRLHMELYRSRTDIQTAFPDPLGLDREGFKNWLQSSAEVDFKLDKYFLTFSTNNNNSGFPWPTTVREKIRGWTQNLISRLRNKLKGPVRKILPADSHLLKYIRKIDTNYLSGKRKFRNVRQSIPSSPIQSLPFGVNVAGYIQGEFGVAEVARASLNALDKVNIPYVLNNVQTVLHRQKDLTHNDFSEENPYCFNLVHVNADQVHEFARQKNQSYFTHHHNIGYWFWELSQFPIQWMDSFDYFQEIWVASTFCQESIARVSPVPVVKMPFPVLIDKDKAKPDKNRFGFNKDKFIFGFAFDYLSFVERKNPFGLVKAFQMAFHQNDDAVLIIKTINSEHDQEKATILQELVQKDRKIKLIDGHLSRNEMVSLTASFDSYISLHRSEGFGIGLAQAMYLGKPVIATGYSGNMEFMDHNNSFLVRYNLTELEESYGPYQKGNIWAEPDIEHAAELLNLVHNDSMKVKKIVRRAEADISTKLMPSFAGEAMKKRLMLLS